MPKANVELNHIFHFKGKLARCAGLTGMGTDNHGNRLASGTGTTDFSYMAGEYWGARAPLPVVTLTEGCRCRGSRRELRKSPATTCSGTSWCTTEYPVPLQVTGGEETHFSCDLQELRAAAFVFRLQAAHLPSPYS